MEFKLKVENEYIGQIGTILLDSSQDLEGIDG